MKRKKLKVFLSHDKNIRENEKWNREFWQNVPDEEKFNAAFELVKTAWLAKGNKLDDLRLKRHIGFFKPAEV